ncbi:hypothetical protein [Streptomyces sp. NPDC001781]
MRQSTKIGVGLMAAGVGSAETATEAPARGVAALAMAAGAFTALGAVSLIIGWTVRPLDRAPAASQPAVPHEGEAGEV